MSDGTPRPIIDWSNYRPPKGAARCPSELSVDELLRRGTPWRWRRARQWERDNSRPLRTYADLSLAVGSTCYPVGCILGVGHGGAHESATYMWVNRTPAPPPAQRTL